MFYLSNSAVLQWIEHRFKEAKRDLTMVLVLFTVKLDLRPWLGFLSPSGNVNCRMLIYLPRSGQKSWNPTATHLVATGRGTRQYKLEYRFLCFHKSRCTLHPTSSYISMSINLSSPLTEQKFIHGQPHGHVHTYHCAMLSRKNHCFGWAEGMGFLF